ncbi:GNAT family N-acetyltransferase [Paenibacillus alkalitolerans]|uniref:GNAT family N-acetyltransferase n=1 Tax=Paenibacillus alkalitolerans TaxID=2799335 RepID=UPI0018F604A3|nr:GNAT family N-acetyltransferase [Paenibacillus alkalitolerans]
MNNQVELKSLNRSNIQDIIKLSRKIGWDYTEADLNTIFACGNIYGHQYCNQVISCAALFPYENMESIGMVIVDPQFQGRGLGKAVTNACISNFLDKPITLVATSEGLPVYNKLGFRQIGTLHKLIALRYLYDEAVEISDDLYVRDYMDTDFYDVVALDERAFGAKREIFLRNRIYQARSKLVVTDGSGKISGFGLSILLPEMLLIGPIIAVNDSVAHYLIHRLAISYKGQLRIDVISTKKELINILLCSGFEVTNIPPVLMLNADMLPSRNSNLYAVAAQAFG